QEAILPGSTGFNYGRAPQVGSPLRIVVHISGKTPRHGRYYRLQIGSFSVRGNATRAADSLKNAGLNPAFEEYQSNVRVVLPRVPGEDVVETARKIGGAGFSDVWCREEP
ncbi:MAG: SPOR domain-containing protein, partial [Spirochaetaceae bacterium]|nr:SPOR domain-containing protein [Spirochaetaceae bacterium]